jgi:hypothetical protein
MLLYCTFTGFIEREYAYVRMCVNAYIRRREPNLCFSSYLSCVKMPPNEWFLVFLTIFFCTLYYLVLSRAHNHAAGALMPRLRTSSSLMMFEKKPSKLPLLTHETYCTLSESFRKIKTDRSSSIHWCPCTVRWQCL